MTAFTRYIHPDDRERYARLSAGIIAGTESYPLEFRAVRPDGQVRWMYVTGQVERVGARAVYVRGVVMDRTEARETDARRHRAQRLESLGLAIGAVAHDLHNVLTPIQLAVDLLTAAPGPDERRAVVLAGVSTSVRRGVGLLGHLLEFASGGDAGDGPVDPAAVLAAVEADVRPGLPPNVRWVSRTVSRLPTVRGDADELRRMVRLVVDNALDAMPEGGTLTLRAQVEAMSETEARVHPEAAAGEYVRLEVRDTGEGIDPEALGRLFVPFYTTRAGEGHLGLGLAAVLAVARRHRGAVDVSSEPGRGTSVRIWLPVAGEG